LLSERVQRLNAWINEVPPGLTLEEQEWAVFRNLGTAVPAVLHASQAVVFGFLGAHWMMLYGLLASPISGAALWLNKSGRGLASMAIMQLELVGMFCLGTALYGLEAGFAYNLPLMVVAPLFNFPRSSRRRTVQAACGLTAAAFVASVTTATWFTPIPLAPDDLMLLFWLNIFTTAASLVGFTSNAEALFFKRP